MKQPDRRWSRVVHTLAFVAFLTWGGAFVLAQGSDPAPAEPDPAAVAPVEQTPPAPYVIPLSEVASEAERIGAEIADIRSLAAPSEAMARVLDEVQTLETSIAGLEQDPVHIDPESVAWSELDSVLRQWRRLAVKLKVADKLVGERSKMLEGRATGIVHAVELWTLTRDALIEQESPDAVIERIDAVLQDLAEVQAALKTRQAELFTLQDRITSDQIRTTQAMDQLSSVSAEARRRIFARTDPPLWAALAEEDDEGPSLREQWKSSWQRSRSDLAEFRQDFKDELVLHALLTVIFMIVLARLGLRARGWAKKEPDLQAIAAVLSRPMAAAYVVAATGTIVLYPDAPAPAYKIAYLTAVVPLFLLVKAIVPADWRRPLYGAVGLFALLHLGRLVPGLQLFQRLLYLLLTLAALIGVVLMLLRLRAEKRSQAGRWWRVIVLGCRVAMVLLALSFLGNVIGAFELTLLFTGGVFNSVYMALATVVSVLILDGAVAAAMETETARKLRMIRSHPQPIRRRISAAIHIGGALLWAWVSLLLFDLLPLILGWITGVLGRKWAAGTLEASLGGILVFVLTIWISVLISRFTRFVLEEEFYPRVRLARGLPGTISMLARYSILAIGFLIAVAAAGIPLSNFAIIAGALSVGIGFGMQNVVNNFVVRSDPGLRATDPDRGHDRGRAGPGRGQDDRDPGQQRSYLRRRGGDRAQRRSDLRAGDQLDALRPSPPDSTPRRRGLRNRSAGRDRPLEGGRRETRGCLDRPETVGVVQRFRRQFAGFRDALLDAGLQSLVGHPQRSRGRGERGVERGGYRDPVPATRPSRAIGGRGSRSIARRGVCRGGKRTWGGTDRRLSGISAIRPRRSRGDCTSSTGRGFRTAPCSCNGSAPWPAAFPPAR